jgi:hypothetical protein
MDSRIHILLDEAEKNRYRRQAEREGKSLGAWLRAAAEDRLRAAERALSLRSRADLQRFFAECDAREHGREPDWSEHRETIEQSRRGGLEVT